jgi:prepilin-type N-terminal cleavage/methylation domain-containing protein
MFNTNKKGVTLIELLIAIAIVSVMMLGVYLTYTSFTKTAIDTRQIARSESEVNQALLKLEKLLQSAGFGIDERERPFFVVSKKLDNSTSITFKTLFGDKIEAGLWEVCVNKTRIVTKNYPVVVLNEEKQLEESYSNTDNCRDGEILYVCKDSNNNGICDNIDDSNDNYFFEKELRLSADTSSNYEWSTHCAPNTRNLLLNNEPYLGCIADFKVDYTDNTVKLGIIYQSGSKNNSPLSKTFSYDFFSESYTLTQNQEYYRWKKVEIILDLVNLK